MQQRIAEARAEGDSFAIRQQWVPLDDISRRLQRAVIVGEDARFAEHEGVDWDALREEFHYRGDNDFSWLDIDDLRALADAAKYYREHSESIRGRSTITQQLAKNLYYSTDRSPLRKIEELFVARRLERFLSKDRILEIYLNVVEWGPGVFGAEAAARQYFRTAASSLSTEQAAMLAATLPHPLTSNPKTRPGRMTWRKNMILARMGGTGPVQTVPLAPEPDSAAAAPPIPLGEIRSDTASAPPDTSRVLPDTLRVRPDTGSVALPPNGIFKPQSTQSTPSGSSLAVGSPADATLRLLKSRLYRVQFQLLLLKTTTQSRRGDGPPIRHELSAEPLRSLRSLRLMNPFLSAASRHRSRRPNENPGTISDRDRLPARRLRCARGATARRAAMGNSRARWLR
jgi:monofunctional biosynthetic peptidoglycan transglycosylase